MRKVTVQIVDQSSHVSEATLTGANMDQYWKLAAERLNGQLKNEVRHPRQVFPSPVQRSAFEDEKLIAGEKRNPFSSL